MSSKELDSNRSGPKELDLKRSGGTEVATFLGDQNSREVAPCMSAAQKSIGCFPSKFKLSNHFSVVPAGRSQPQVWAFISRQLLITLVLNASRDSNQACRATPPLTGGGATHHWLCNCLCFCRGPPHSREPGKPLAGSKQGGSQPQTQQEPQPESAPQTPLS